MRHFLVLLILVFTGHDSFSQVGGEYGYGFVKIPSSARQAALGGIVASEFGQDVNFFWENPALIDSTLNMHGSISYTDYLADINLSQVSYAHDFGKRGIWFGGVKYFNLGEINGFDAAGNPTGKYTGGEYLIAVGHVRQSGNFRAGMNVKFAGSGIAGFSSSALLADLGGIFVHPASDLFVGLSIVNLGIILKKYTEESDTGLPLDVRLGFGFKPEHMPVRFSMTAFNLVSGNVAYFDPDGSFNEEEPNTFDRILRHLNFAAEFLIHRNFSAVLGYNHMRRKELRLPVTSGGAGLSFGFALKVSYFELIYSRLLYHVAGGSNTFTVSTNFGRLLKKKS